MKMPILFACLVAAGLAVPADAAPRPSNPAAGLIQINDDSWSPPNNYRPWPPAHDRPWYDRNRGDWYGPPLGYRPAPYYDYAPHRPRGILPLGIVLRKLQRRNFWHVEDIRLRDNVYKVRAVDRYGRAVRLIVDPVTGEILRLRYAG